MIDKSHCKIAYDTETDMLENIGHYDFSSSYPDVEERPTAEAGAKGEKGQLAEAGRGDGKDVNGSDDGES